MVNEKTPMTLCFIAEQIQQTLQLGSRGPEVTKLQERLASLKYNLGPRGIDGKFGQYTQKAVMQFQTDNNIRPSGIVNDITNSSLYSKIPLRGSLSKIGAGTTAGIPSKVSKPISQIPSQQITKTSNRVPPQQIKKTNNNVPQRIDINKPIQPKSGIKSFVRKLSPNVAQMFFTKPLSGNDFSRKQKSVIYNVIQNAIKRGQKRNRGVTSYMDYGPNIQAAFDNTTGVSTKDILTKSFTDPYFQVASTLGRFTYRLQPNGVYFVTDTYDFSKGRGYTVTKDEIKDMPYLQQLKYVMKKDNLSPYRAARQIAYIEHPDTAPESQKIKINLMVDPREFTAKKNVV